MSRCSPWGVALLVFAFVVGSGLAQDKKDAVAKDAAAKDAAKKDDAKKDDPKTPAPKVPDKKEAENKLLKTQLISGELVHIETNKQAFRIKVTYQYSEPNQGAIQAYAKAQQDYALARDINARNNALRAMMQHQANLYTTKSTSKEYGIEAAENMKVRLPAPKTEFDDMGNLKKFTAKELAAKRGPDKMFDGEFTDLTTGQIVQVTILVPKAPAKPVKKDDLTLQEDPKIEATKVAVLKQPTPGK
jgi:hypothetical protein